MTFRAKKGHTCLYSDKANLYTKQREEERIFIFKALKTAVFFVFCFRWNHTNFIISQKLIVLILKIKT